MKSIKEKIDSYINTQTEFILVEGIDTALIMFKMFPPEKYRDVPGGLDLFRDHYIKTMEEYIARKKIEVEEKIARLSTSD